MKKRLHKAQHILEYVIVLTALVGAIILASRAVIPNRVRDYMKGSANVIKNSAPVYDPVPLAERPAVEPVVVVVDVDDSSDSDWGGGG